MRILSIALLLILSAAPALAWGPAGHEITAEIAARKLTPAARAEVERLLGDRASNAMREWSGWPDGLRTGTGYGNPGPLHYLNFPRGNCHYSAKRDCRDGRCVVAAITHFVDVLQHGHSDGERADALKWVIHLIADVHQPLHAGYGDDRGGNDVQVRFRREGMNLHKLLDSGLLNRRRLRAVAYADAIIDEQAALPIVRLRWSDDAPVRWAEESCAIVRDEVYPDGNSIDDEYETRVRAILEQRLYLGGERLATVLNSVLR